jgi:hypothetical protein
MLVFQGLTNFGQFVQKALGITFLFLRVSQVFADRSEVITKWVFYNRLQPAVDFHTPLSRASLKAFLLKLTYNFIIRFGLSSSSSPPPPPPPHFFLDIRDLDWFSLARGLEL